MRTRLSVGAGVEAETEDEADVAGTEKGDIPNHVRSIKCTVNYYDVFIGTGITRYRNRIISSLHNDCRNHSHNKAGFTQDVPEIRERARQH